MAASTHESSRREAKEMSEMTKMSGFSGPTGHPLPSESESASERVHFHHTSLNVHINLKSVCSYLCSSWQLSFLILLTKAT